MNGPLLLEGEEVEERTGAPIPADICFLQSEFERGDQVHREMHKRDAEVDTVNYH